VSNINKTTPFKPSIINTSHINLNFGAKKSPKTLPRSSHVSFTAAANKSKENKQTRQSTDAGKSRKSAGIVFSEIFF